MKCKICQETAVPQFSAVRTYVLTDTVEYQESRFAGLTSLTNYVKLRHYPRNRDFHLGIQVTIPMLGKILTNRGKEPMFRQMNMFIVEIT